MNAQKKSMLTLTAPRMRTRRIARVYFFPWAQLVGAFLLLLFGWRSRIPAPPLLLYTLFIALICTIEDLAASQSRIMRLLCLSQNVWRKLRQKPRRNRGQKNDLQNFFTCAPPPFFAYRYLLRWPLALTTVVSTWEFAWAQAALFSDPLLANQLIFTFSLFAIGLIPYAMFIVSPMPYLQPITRRRVWYTLGALGPLLALFCLRSITTDARIVLFGMAFYFLLYATIFAVQRLWVGQKVWNDIIRDISLQSLTWPQASQKLDRIPPLLCSQLRLDRVFILQPTPDEQYLQVTAEFGDYQSVLHKRAPVGESLTGRAFQEKKPVAWNNVDECPYYHSLCPDDDTKAEIAIPIIYRGTVYGILDAQTKVKGAYSPNDVDALETIASILGAAIAVEQREQFFRNAVEMWQHVMGLNVNLATEQDVFNVFAEFVQSQLKADLIIYYPLSLAGYPVRKPFVYGQSKKPGLMYSPINDPHSSLIQLVAEWKPYFEPCVTNESLVTQFSPPGAPGFVEREGIVATCFLPVGTYQERLGALFLNFRRPKMFDDSFQFTVLSLAQSLAQATSQVRYRDVVYKSFGRPEINVHGVIGRYGFKKGLKTQVQQLEMAGHCGACATMTECRLYPLVNQIDNCVAEVRLAESAHPPDFWEESLDGRLEIFKSALPNRAGGRRPRLKWDIDDCIEEEYPLVKLALYRIITESISNAIFHGDARRIHVIVRRQFATIETEINNDGRPLPHNAKENESKNGIYALLNECDVKLGGVSGIRNKPDSSGVCVSVAIPALPRRARINRRSSLQT